MQESNPPISLIVKPLISAPVSITFEPLGVISRGLRGAMPSIGLSLDGTPLSIEDGVFGVDLIGVS